MPEGDTIHQTARTLRTVLEGTTLRRFETGGRIAAGGVPTPQEGERIGPVTARGKHLLIGFSGGLTLHTHLQMTGSWHTCRAGERWQRPRRRMTAAIGTEEADAVCFDAPVVELLDPAALARHRQLRTLGPDLCLPAPDLDAVVRNLDALEPATPIGVALLDQTVAAGIGNVYKSEALWAERVDPFAPLSAISEATRRTLYATAARQLRANLRSGGPRRTVAEGVAVYDRARAPCRRCGTPIRTRRQGTTGRSTWWCPACQT